MIELEFRDEQIRALLNAIIRKTGDASEAFEGIGDEMLLSIEKNFAAGGRYSSPEDIIGGSKKWRPLSETTLAIKRRQGKPIPPQILVVSQGGLAASINKKVSKDHVEVYASKEYAAMQQFGAKKGQFGVQEVLFAAHSRYIAGKKRPVKAHKRKVKVPFGNVPARPFMTLHPESIDIIIGMLGDYITEI